MWYKGPVNTKLVGVNERIKGATSLEQVALERHESSTQYQASAKTLRKRARLVATKKEELIHE